MVSFSKLESNNGCGSIEHVLLLIIIQIYIIVVEDSTLRLPCEVWVYWTMSLVIFRYRYWENQTVYLALSSQGLVLFLLHIIMKMDLCAVFCDESLTHDGSNHLSNYLMISLRLIYYGTDDARHTFTIESITQSNESPNESPNEDAHSMVSTIRIPTSY
eukprot:522595_1